MFECLLFSMQFITNFTIKTLFWECSQNAGNAISETQILKISLGDMPPASPHKFTWFYLKLKFHIKSLRVIGSDYLEISNKNKILDEDDIRSFDWNIKVLVTFLMLFDPIIPQVYFHCYLQWNIATYCTMKSQAQNGA
jgi:hypothetical protein